jgi:hypothetical protein
MIKDRVANFTTDTPEQMHEKAVAACAQYRNALDEANAARRAYRERDLPALFDRLQKIEVARLDVQKEHLQRFCTLLQDLVTPLQALTDRLSAEVAAMDTDEDVNDFIENWVSVHGEPPPLRDLEYELPVTAEALRAGHWEGRLGDGADWADGDDEDAAASGGGANSDAPIARPVGGGSTSFGGALSSALAKATASRSKAASSSSPSGVGRNSTAGNSHALVRSMSRAAAMANSIFGASLSRVMELQRAQGHEAATLPVVLTTLVDSIRSLDGVATEGIFRISAPKAQLDQLHAEFERGNYAAIRAPSVSSPHVPAGLLKMWLRELGEPLIVAYDDAIACVSDGSATQASVRAFYEARASPLTRQCVAFLVKLLVDIVRNSDENKMTVRNLAIVFAPSFLRCPSDDPMVMLTNSKYETQFTVLLLEALVGAQ